MRPDLSTALPHATPLSAASERARSALMGPAVRIPLTVFVLSRVLLIAVAALVEVLVHPHYPGTPVTDLPILRSLTSYDAVYYLGIAGQGYHAGPVVSTFHDTAFFPLFPLLTRIASPLTAGDVALAGVLVSNVAFLAALVMAHRLAARELGQERADRSIAFLAFAPGAVAFGMAYSDSLGLLLSLLAVSFALDRRYATMGAALALAALTRPPGILAIVPLAIIVARQPGAARSAWAWLAAGPVAILGFFGYLGLAVGDPLASLRAQEAWQSDNLRPLLDLVAPASPTTGTPPTAPVGQLAPSTESLALAVFALILVVLLVHVALFVYLRRDRIPLAHAAYAVATVAETLVLGRLASIPRYLAMGWPFAWLAAGRGGRMRRGLLIGSVAAYTCFAALHFAGALAP